MNNPGYSVRFFIRATKRQRGTTPAPLRIRVWIGAQKGFIYLSTANKVTPDQWKLFQSDGTPLSGADPKVIKIVDGLRAAVGLVLNHAATSGTIATLTSEKFRRLVEGVVWMMNQHHRPPVIGATPEDLSICARCAFRAKVCRAPWPFMLAEYENQAGEIVKAPEGVPTIERADTAADFAQFSGFCMMRVINGEWRPTPGGDTQITELSEAEAKEKNRITEAAKIIEIVSPDPRKAAAIIEAEKGGNNG